MKKRCNIVDIIIVAALVLLLCLIFIPVFFISKEENGGIADENGDGKVTLEDYSGKKIGVISGVDYDAILSACVPGAKTEYYDSYPDLIVALKAGVINAVAMDGPSLDVIMNQDPYVGKVPEPMETWYMSFAFSDKSEIPGLNLQMNEFLHTISENGTMQEINDVWFGADDSVKVIPPLENLSGENGTVRVALETTYEPIVYVKNQEIVGYEPDILYRFCEYYHYGLEYMPMQYDAVLPAVVTGKCDIGGSGLEYTEDHADSIIMSEPHFTSRTYLAVPITDLPEGRDLSVEKAGLWERIYSSIDKNLLQENRWMLIVEGIGTTCFITFFSTLFGTLIAFGMCLLRRTKSRLANPLCDRYIRFFQGIPIVILLMILFYVILNDSGMAAVWVAVIGFSISYSAHFGEIMQSGLDSVDKGQEEAALALGYTKNEAFFRFMFPQAAVRFLPVYRGELVTLLNDTSVVGYIAVQDLTKMSDIIRSRSYEAFLPLILSTLIYFLLARLITLLIDALLKLISTKHRGSFAGGEKA